MSEREGNVLNHYSPGEGSQGENHTFTWFERDAEKRLAPGVSLTCQSPATLRWLSTLWGVIGKDLPQTSPGHRTSFGQETFKTGVSVAYLCDNF